MKGAELTPWLIRYAYSQGAFPMATDEGEVEWYQPRVRALLPIDGIHVSRSLKKVLRSGRFEVTFDKAFEQVMRGCLRPDGNWINEDLIRVYTQIHFEGWGHSVEVWQQGELAGGLYGIALGSCFCAESMFHRATNASKVALRAMVDRCRESGFTMFDAQVMNSHLASLGAYPMPHEKYMDCLRDALARPTRWPAPESP